MQDMRFGVIRDAAHKNDEVFILDDKTCPACHWPTEVREGFANRRYCTNKKCNSMIMEDV